MDSEKEVMEHQLKLWREKLQGNVPGSLAAISPQPGRDPATEALGPSSKRDDLKEFFQRFLSLIRIRSLLLYGCRGMEIMPILRSNIITSNDFHIIDLNKIINKKHLQDFLNIPLSFGADRKYIYMEHLELLHYKRGWIEVLLKFMEDQYHGVTLIGTIGDLRLIDPRICEAADKILVFKKEGQHNTVTEVEMPPKKRIAKESSHAMSLRGHKRVKNTIQKKTRAPKTKKVNKKKIVPQTVQTETENSVSPPPIIIEEPVPSPPSPARPPRPDTALPAEVPSSSRNFPISIPNPMLSMVPYKPDMALFRNKPNSPPMLVCSTTGMFLSSPGNVPSLNDVVQRATLTQPRSCVHRYKCTVHEPGPSRNSPQPSPRPTTSYMNQNQWTTYTESVIGNMDTFQALVSNNYQNRNYHPFNSPQMLPPNPPCYQYSNNMACAGVIPPIWNENMAPPAEFFYPEPFLPNEPIILSEDEGEEEEN